MIEEIEIYIKKGAVFSTSCVMRNDDGTPRDLTGKLITAQLREYAEAVDAADFAVSVTGNRVALSLTAVQTAGITYQSGVYDVFIEADDPDDRELLWQGNAVIYTDVTRMPWMQMGIPMSVLEMPSLADFPVPGMTRMLYLDAAENRLYRWDEAQYVCIQSVGFDWDDIVGKPDVFPPEAHNHDGVYAAIDHDHDGVYSPVDHDHDGVYSPVGHNHDADYSAIDHTHDYSEIENTPILGSLAEKDSVDWDTDIDNIPTEFPPESHTHDDRYYTETETDALLSEKASIIRTSSSGSLVHLTDAAAMSVDALTVGIEPVQDLHGYANPWPAGGGENKCNIADFTSTSSARMCNTDGVAVSAGTYTVSFDFTSTATDKRVQAIITSNATVTQGTSDPAGIIVREYVQAVSGSRNSITITTASSGYFYLRIVSDGGTTSKIQLESGSSATSYAPYSNVCPISGHATATVTRTGKNLLGEFEQGTVDYNGINNNSSNRIRSKYYTPVKAGQTYTYKAVATTSGKTVNYSVSFYTDDDYTTHRMDYVNWTPNQLTFTVPTGAKYARFLLAYSDGTSVTTASFTDIQLEVGSVASAYQPYQPILQITIDLDGTRYGATVDALTGVMTVDRAYIADMSSLSWSKQNTTSGNWRFNATPNPLPKRTSSSSTIPDGLICSIYSAVTPNNTWGGSLTGVTINNSSNELLVCDMSYSDADTFRTAMNGVQLVYPLAAPFTVQLTPAELSLLFGTNNVWANSGDVNVGYRADTRLFIERKITELTALILEN